MRSLFNTFVGVLVLCCSAVHAAQSEPKPSDLAGTWLGTLELGPIELRLGFNLTADVTGRLSGSLISIDQGGVAIPISSIESSAGQITLTAKKIGGTFTGKVASDADSIEGTWSQGLLKTPLTLRRVDLLPTQNRPQHPKRPFPYEVQQVTFKNPAGGHTLAGTLTLPKTKGPFGAVVMVSGSGPQDRDETLLGHKPFLVLADMLTRRGVAVLRYDDRGVGESTGKFEQATSQDFATDALAAVRYLAKHDKINPAKIGIGGHSEGGLIGPMVASQQPAEIAFLVLLAPPGIPGDEVIASQTAAIEQQLGVPPAAIEAMAAARQTIFALVASLDEAEPDKQTFEQQLTTIIAEVPDSYFVVQPDLKAARKLTVDTMLSMVSGPWFRFFLSHDPREDLSRVECPVLAILCEKDVQVLPSVNLAPLKAALEKSPSKDITVRELPGLNHLLQTAPTGMPAEYGQIEETIAPVALRLIGEWVQQRAGGKP